MRRIYAVVAIALATLLIVAFTASPAARADFGDFDTGGDWGGGSDWGGSDWDYDSDWGSHSSGGHRGGGSASPGSVLASMLLMLAWPVVKILERIAQFVRQHLDNIKYKLRMHSLKDLQKSDSDFNWTDMQEWIRELYTHMQADWEAGDIRDLEPDFEHSCWQRFDRQLQTKKQQKFQGHVRNIQFLSIDMLGWCQEESIEYLDVGLKTNIISWNTNEAGEITTGSQTIPKDMEYLWRHQRPAPGKTAPRSACPGCGIDVSALMSRCPGCHAQRRRDPNAWVIYDITGMPRQGKLPRRHR